MLILYILINGMIYFMSELILSFLLIGFAFTCLAIGLIFKNQPIKGSCGGIANLVNVSKCEICGRSDPQNCKE